MILVMGGAKESNEVVRILRSKNPGSAATSNFKASYGETVSDGVVFMPRSLNCPMTAHLIRKYEIKVLIDATPIYFTAVPKKIMSACRMAGARYIRFEPPVACFKDDQKVYMVRNIEEACEKAVGFGETVFLNIGNDNINLFTEKAEQRNKKIVIRVSEYGGITNSLRLGIGKHNILLIDGVFSETFYRGLIKEYGISVFVTRELGKGNGTEQEFSAASAEGIPIIIIKRPSLSYPEVIRDYYELVQAVFRR